MDDERYGCVLSVVLWGVSLHVDRYCRRASQWFLDQTCVNSREPEGLSYA